MDHLKQAFKTSSKSVPLPIYRIGNVPALSNNSTRQKRLLLSKIYFLPSPFFYFLPSIPAVYSVGNRRYIDLPVPRYSKHNVIADIGRRRSRYTHLFSSYSRRAFPPRLAACLRPNGNLHAGQILFRRRPQRSFTISFPHCARPVQSFVRSFFDRFCATVRLSVCI